MFCAVRFNDNLAKHPLYAQYDFSDRWFFPVALYSEDSPSGYGIDNLVKLARTDGQFGEVPDFVWLKGAYPGHYG